MASDASIKRVEELSVFSSHLQGFCDSMISNGTAFANVMVQKQEELRGKERIADEMVKDLEKAENEAEHAMANCPSEEYILHEQLYKEYIKLHEQLTRARRLQGEIHQNVTVASFAVRHIMELVKQFQNNSKELIGQGREFLKKASVQLQQYKEKSI